MNDLPPKMFNGVIGELVAQLSLIEHNVQAAPPLRDSGNDLIACKGDVILALQVKARLTYSFSRAGLPRKYDGLIFIHFEGYDGRIDLSRRRAVYLLTRQEFLNTPKLGKKGLKQFVLTPKRVEEVFRCQNMLSFELNPNAKDRRTFFAKRFRKAKRRASLFLS
jgi:hypothetical protein